MDGIKSEGNCAMLEKRATYACLRKIARVSESPKSSDPAEQAKQAYLESGTQ
jgi:hypothetical protein